ncbi:MAG TPA: MotA/TolQ/ExbB proton channel family protein [Tepidisphaeraceae bacterium]|jgi:biopolymer transport protein ExbB|nr:MotA/TolQ/ExbB proton channel family protein [Tepidisphaeraceae bacterium]
MRGYANSRLRLALLVMLFSAALFVVAGPGLADTTADKANQVAQSTSVFQLVMANRDPVFFTILGLSIWGLTLIIQGFLVNRASVIMPPRTIETIREMIAQRRFKELIDFTETDPSFVSRALNPALKRAPSFSSMKEAMETAVGEQTADQFRKIEYLNIIGNLGPLLGLLGTVIGMIDAFLALNASGGNASPANLAFGISKALVHTMLGLLLAIPCLAAFGFLRTIVDKYTVRASLIAEELLLMIKPAEARPAAVGAMRPGAMPQPAPQIPRKPATPIPVPGAQV